MTLQGFPSKAIYELATQPPRGYLLTPELHPPRACSMERGLIGAILLKNDLYYRAEVTQLEVTDFYSVLTQEIWMELGRLMSESPAAVDVLLLGTHLESKPHLRNKGLAGYLVGLAAMEAAPEPLLDPYVNLIKDTSGLRQLCVASMHISNKILRRDNQKDPRKSLQALRDEAYQEYRSIFDKTAKTQEVFGYKDTTVCGGTLQQFLTSRSHLSSNILPTPYTELSDLLGGGLKSCGYYIIAARPGMGKTTLALNLADHVCKANRERNHVLILSMEMQADELFQKSLISETGERWENIANRYSQEARWDHTRAKWEEIQGWPLYLSTPYTLTAEELQQVARRTFKLSEKRLGLIIIDYVQLMSTNSRNKYTSNRTQEISEISRVIKGLANELDLPIVVLSQLNRNLEERQDRRPVLSDLRDSGALEQDADVVMFLYRQEVYSKDRADAGEAELIVAKNRMGPIGHVKLSFEGQYSRFVSQTFCGPKSETLSSLFTADPTTPSTQSIAQIAEVVKRTQVPAETSVFAEESDYSWQSTAKRKTVKAKTSAPLKNKLSRKESPMPPQVPTVKAKRTVQPKVKVSPRPQTQQDPTSKTAPVNDQPSSSLSKSSQPPIVEPVQEPTLPAAEPSTEEPPLVTLRKEEMDSLAYEDYGFTQEPEDLETDADHTELIE